MNLFNSWDAIVGIVVAGAVCYLFVVVAVRITGKRTTSKMNNFDWIVTVALGSLVGSTILSADVALLEGFSAIAILLLMQWIFTKASVYSDQVNHMLHSQPTLLVYRGELLDEAMRRERVTRQEVLAAVREQGIGDLDEVWAVAIESDGELSVLPRSGSQEPSLLHNVEGMPESS